MASPSPEASDRWQQPPWRWVAQLIGAITFYTQIPLSNQLPTNFEGIARYAPVVGLVLGGALALLDQGLGWLHFPTLTRSGLVIALGVWLTGGLHLDGAMDTADGLAVPEPARRLTVMADSRAGAFGVMVAIILLGLKVMALTDMPALRWFALMATAGWGRWGQVVAIARYPYLKATGKGAFHKAHAQPATDWLVGFVALGLLTGIALVLRPGAWIQILLITLGGIVLSILAGVWINHVLGGHTGDTYGAIVEWTEALLLCLMVGLQSFQTG